jgi:hypothetical protein
MKPLLGIGKRYDIAIKRDRYEVYKKVLVVGYKDGFRIMCFRTRKGGIVYEIPVDCIHVLN